MSSDIMSDMFSAKCIYIYELLLLYILFEVTDTMASFSLIL